MKKICLLLSFFLVLSSQAHAASADGRTTHGPFVRLLIVEGRGLSNLGFWVLEFPRTGISEVRMHKWAWPLTYFPKVILHLGVRLASSVNDILLYPWVVPFTDDLSPWTEAIGIPDYPWQWGEGNL